MSKTILSNQEMIGLISDKLDFFTKVTSCDRRTYLTVAAVFNQFQLELAGVIDFEDDIDSARLEEINNYIETVFVNLQLEYPQK